MMRRAETERKLYKTAPLISLRTSHHRLPPDWLREITWWPAGNLPTANCIYSLFHPGGLVGDQMFDNPGSEVRLGRGCVINFLFSSFFSNSHCLYSPFKSFTHFLHFRRVRFLFPPLSMHEVNGAGEHQRSIILLQDERSGRL